MRRATVLALAIAAVGLGSAYGYLVLASSHGGSLLADQLSVGRSHRCAITSSGSARCWGSDRYGELGDGGVIRDDGSSDYPVQVMGLNEGVTDISVSPMSHSCAVHKGGAKCWGSNSYGQLGDGTRTDRSAPVQVVGLESNVVSVAAGEIHSCALTTAGSVLCWGNDHEHQAGSDPTLGIKSVRPVGVPGLSAGIVSIKAGHSHTCALTSTGVVGCWGNNRFGQLGDGTRENRITPVRVAELFEPVESLSVWGGTTCAVTAQGGAYCWGNNSSGQIGDGTTISALVPTPVIGLQADVASISVGGMHTCAVTKAGASRCWGGNEYGEFGNGTRAGSFIPVPTRSTGVVQIVSGGFYGCGLFRREIFVENAVHPVYGDVAHCWGGVDDRPVSLMPVEVTTR